MQNLLLTHSNEYVKIQTQSNECVFREANKGRISIGESNILIVNPEQKTKLQRRLNYANQNDHRNSVPKDPGCVYDHRLVPVLPS